MRRSAEPDRAICSRPDGKAFDTRPTNVIHLCPELTISPQGPNIVTGDALYIEAIATEWHTA